MILCHKCSGRLEGTKTISSLYDCRCMSGWIRGFEPNVTEQEALLAQTMAQMKRLELYKRQGRSSDDTIVVHAELLLTRLQESNS